MQFSLQAGEAALLRRILTSYLSNLRMEVHKTDDYDLRQDLKRDEAAIKGMLVRLEAAAVGNG
jgi:hypothetical protein